MMKTPRSCQKPLVIDPGDATARLSVSAQTLTQVRTALGAGIREGLQRDGAEIMALPAYLAPASRETKGEAIVVDSGGSNMRAALVALQGEGQAKLLAGPITEPLPSGRNGSRPSATEFFSAQAALVAELDAPAGLHVGYCFSYPSEALPNLDARLTRWTKGVDIPGVEGTLVGSQLREALAQAGVDVGKVRVLNDTVAALLGGTYGPASTAKVSDVIGFIAGTGTNTAAAFPLTRLTKLTEVSGPAWDGQKMAVDINSGAFGLDSLTDWDRALDQQDARPGTQLFEKAVAGFYLPYLLAQICPDTPGFDPALGAGQLVRYRDASPEQRQQEAAEILVRRLAADAGKKPPQWLATNLGLDSLVSVAVLATRLLADARYAEQMRATCRCLEAAGWVAATLLERSADLQAAALAAVIDVVAPTGPVGILAEGSLFWKDPRYAPRFETTLANLLTPTHTALVLSMTHANLVGAACAALGGP